MGPRSFPAIANSAFIRWGRTLSLICSSNGKRQWCLFRQRGDPIALTDPKAIFGGPERIYGHLTARRRPVNGLYSVMLCPRSFLMDGYDFATYLR